MIVIEEGKNYEIPTAQGGKMVLTFCHAVIGEDGKKQFVDGITSEELLKVLIHRHGGYANAVQTAENINVLTFLNQALVWLNARTVSKINRKRNKQQKV